MQRAKAINEAVGDKFGTTDYKAVLQDMADNPEQLELFLIQCLSMAAIVSPGPAGEELSDRFMQCAVQSSGIIESIRMAGEIIKGN